MLSGRKNRGPLHESGEIRTDYELLSSKRIIDPSEYLDDYAEEDTKKLGSAIIDRELLHIPNEKARETCASLSSFH